MVDIVDEVTRSRMMSSIRGKNTKPEILIRKALHSTGYRFRIHRRDLPGKPDIVLPKYHVAIFVHGCFWHGHDCPMFKLPGSNVEFWRNKINSNQRNDHKIAETLNSSGWRILTVWECATKGKGKLAIEDIMSQIRDWLASGDSQYEVRGKHAPINSSSSDAGTGLPDDIHKSTVG